MIDGDLHRKHTNKKKLGSVRFLCKTSGKLIFRPIFSNQEMLLSNLKPVATLQYKPEGLHVLF